MVNFQPPKGYAPHWLCGAFPLYWNIEASLLGTLKEVDANPVSIGVPGDLYVVLMTNVPKATNELAPPHVGPG